MTTQDILELAARVEAATGPDRELDAAISVAMAGNTGLVELAGPDCAAGTYWVTLDGGAKSLKTATPWTASLDAAMTLVPEGAKVTTQNFGAPGPMALVEPNERFTSGKTLALALAAAALKARAHTKGEE